jgi:hypothetical protein
MKKDDPEWNLMMNYNQMMMKKFLIQDENQDYSNVNQMTIWKMKMNMSRDRNQ